MAGAGLDVFEQEPLRPIPVARYGARDREPACTLLDRRMFNAIATDGLTSVVAVARSKRPAHPSNPAVSMLRRWAQCADRLRRSDYLGRST